MMTKKQAGEKAKSLLEKYLATIPESSDFTELKELRTKLLAEAEDSSLKNASVAMKWADLFAIEIPQVMSIQEY